MARRNSIRKSNIWTCFVVSNENSSYARCKESQCNTSISRGTCVRQYSTKPLWNHLKFKHRDKYKTLAMQKLRSNSGEETEISIIEQIEDVPLSPKPEVPAIDSPKTFINKKSKWRPSNKKSKLITNGICELMANDVEPYEIVNRTGFKKLISILVPNYYLHPSSYFEYTAMPQFYNAIKEDIQKELDDAKFISLTSDILTNNSNVSFINLCVHFIDSKMLTVCYTLKCQRLPANHTDLNVIEFLSNVINEWIIDETKIHLFLMDPELNMPLTIGFTSVEKTSWFLNTLKLIIHEELFSKKVIDDVIKRCIDIVSHFKHSSSIDEKYKEIRESLVKAKRTGESGKSGFLTVYYMLQRLCELRETIFSYTEERKISNMTEAEWSLIESVVNLLKPIDEIIKLFMRENEVISCIIPMMQLLYSYLKKRSEDEAEMNLIKSDMKKSFEAHFLEGENSLYDKKIYVLSTMLDPRFKQDFNDDQERAKKWLFMEMINLNETVTALGDVTDIENIIIHDEEDAINLTEEANQEFWSCFHELANGTEPDESECCINVEIRGQQRVPVTSPEKQQLYNKELEKFLHIPLTDRDCDPLLWWKANGGDFPNLKLCMLKYLSAPSTMYFEHSCNVKVKKHLKNLHNLSTDHIEMLMFIGRNRKGNRIL